MNFGLGRLVSIFGAEARAERAAKREAHRAMIAEKFPSKEDGYPPCSTDASRHYDETVRADEAWVAAGDIYAVPVVSING